MGVSVRNRENSGSAARRTGGPTMSADGPAPMGIARSAIARLPSRLCFISNLRPERVLPSAQGLRADRGPAAPRRLKRTSQAGEDAPSRQLVEERLGVLQIGRVEAFREPGVDR